MQSLDAQDSDVAALAALGVGGPNLLQAMNNAGSFPSYDTGRRHVEGTPRIHLNGLPSLPSLLGALSHILALHLWHQCIEEIHVEDAITASRKALAMGFCCRHPMPFAHGDDVEALAQRLEEDPDTYDAANQASVVFLAPHAKEG